MSNTTAKKTTPAKKATAKKSAVPAGAKLPTDRKAPADAAPETVTMTAQGLEIEVAATLLDDFDFVAEIAALEDGGLQRIPSVLKRLAGEQFDDVMKHLRDDQGRASLNDAATLIMDLLESADPNS